MNRPPLEPQRAGIRPWVNQRQAKQCTSQEIQYRDEASAVRVNPLGVASHLRHFLRPLTAIAIGPALSTTPCADHALRAHFDPHISAQAYLVLHFSDDIGRGGPGPEYPRIPLARDLGNLRGLVAADGRHHLARTDGRREYQLAWH
jgi:hypothetical protein